MIGPLRVLMRHPPGRRIPSTATAEGLTGGAWAMAVLCSVLLLQCADEATDEAGRTPCNRKLPGRICDKCAAKPSCLSTRIVSCLALMPSQASAVVGGGCQKTALAYAVHMRYTSQGHHCHTNPSYSAFRLKPATRMQLLLAKEKSQK